MVAIPVMLFVGIQVSEIQLSKFREAGGIASSSPAESVKGIIPFTVLHHNLSIWTNWPLSTSRPL
jgi:hypothetical protein